jgi:hypothetical protein
MHELSTDNRKRMDENNFMSKKRDSEDRGGVIRGFEKDEPSISEFSDTPQPSEHEDDKKKPKRRFGRMLNDSENTSDFNQVVDSPLSPKRMSPVRAS